MYDETCVYQAIVPTVGIPKFLMAIHVHWVLLGCNGISTIAFRVFGGEVTNYNDEHGHRSL